MSTASDAGREIQLESGWKAELDQEFRSDYMTGLRQYLLQRKRAGAIIYPPGPEIFAAFNNTPFGQAKVVILGQDPYHGPGQAHGLCFSVRPGVPVPPSLVNMYKELRDDVGFQMPEHGYLLPWARQGVLLLNAVLTVERGQAASHRGQGWEAFTDRAVQCLNEDRDGLVFLLWGSAAQKKGAVIDRQRHLVLTAPHPSPLSAHRGFFGCRHFSRTNDYLRQQGRDPIDWQLPLQPAAEPAFD